MSKLPVQFRVARINELIASLKEDFEAYIADTSIPLNERWEVFVEANDALSNHANYLNEYEFTSINMDKVHEDWSDVGEVYGRGKQISTVEWVSELIENTQLPSETGGNGWRESRTDQDWLEAEKIVAPVKEEILKHNLKHFCFDW